MATALKVAYKRRGSFMPYHPCEPGDAPQVLPGMQPPNPDLTAKVESFYRDLQDDLKGRSRRSRSRSRSRSSSRSSSRSRSR
jgi:hypothetical protein